MEVHAADQYLVAPGEADLLEVHARLAGTGLFPPFPPVELPGGVGGLVARGGFAQTFFFPAEVLGLTFRTPWASASSRRRGWRLQRSGLALQRSGGRVYISLLMGKRGFLRREASPKEVLEHCLRLAREVAPPTPKGKRGRPWRYSHALYLALLLFRAFFHLTYRETEASLQDLMEGPFPSHQSLARYALKHLDPKLLEALLERLSRELEAHLAPESSPEGEAASDEAPAHLAALSPPLPHGHHGAGLPEQGPASPLSSGEGGAAGAGARAASGPDAVG